MCAAMAGDHSNRSTAIFDAVLDAFNDRAWDTLVDLYADDFFVEDRRAGLANSASGKAGSLDGWRVVADLGGFCTSRDHLSVIDNHLSVTAVRFMGDDRTEGAPLVDVVFLTELDTAGRIVRAVLLEADQAQWAIDEIGRRSAGERSA